MKKIGIKKYLYLGINIFIVCIFLFTSTDAKAAVLLPGNITTCGELAVPGTYTITQNIVGSSDTCFLISSDNVVIEGGGYTISGSASTAIDGRAYTSSVLTEGAHGYTNLIINDLTLSGYTTGIDLSGNSDSTGTGVNNGYGGDAGDVAIYYSYVGSVISNGGNSSSQAYGGLGGNIAFTDTNLNISNSTISALGGVGTTGRNTNGGLDLNYSGALNKNNTTLSALAFLNENATSSGVFPGGGFPTRPGNVDSCGTLYGSGIYTLTQNLVSSSTCFIVISSGITINGNGYSITAPTSTSSFAISVGPYSNFTLASTTVNTFTNLITSSSSVTVSGHNLDLTNKFIAAGSLTLNHTGTLSKIGATVSSLSSLTVNGTSYGAQVAGQLFDWFSRNSGSRDWRSITSSSDGTKLAAVVYGGQIYTSTDSGTTWTARDSNRLWRSITSSSDGTKLAAVVWGGQIYTSTDSGVTWTARDSNRSWTSITSSADGTKLATAVFNGQIYTSIDSGATWTARDSNRSWTSITSSADGTKLAAVVTNGQIYTSIDSGATWTARESSRPWRSITSSSDGTKLAAVAEGGQIYTSTDSGVTWTARESSRVWYSITSNSAGDKLAAVVYSGQIYTSTDSGVTWTARESSRTWSSITSNSAGDKLAATVQNGQIYTHQDDTPELKVDILSPNSGVTLYTWQSPIISWGSAASCYYSYDNFVSTSTANCASLGSDISSPGLGSKTLYVKGIDTNGVVVEKNVSFTLSLPITITAPTSNQTVTTWNPVIDWDPNNTGDITSCYYSYDNFVSTSTANCAGTGGDIMPPGAVGSTTLYLKTVNSSGEVGVNSVGFIYSGTSWIPRDSSRNWTSITSSADGNKLAAVVFAGQIFTSTDSGLTWTPRESNRLWRSVTSSASGDKLAAVVNGGQIYTSTDSGVTWTTRDSSRQWYSITSSADGTKLAAVVTNGQIYTSTDSGVTWTARESSRNWHSITSSSDGTKLAASHRGGKIYTSTDSGVTWTPRESSRQWWPIASSDSGDKLVGGDYGGQIYTYDLSSENISIIRPTTSSSVLARAWSSLVNWGSSVSCYYSYNNFVSTSTANCASNGTDIAYPLVRGTNTLYIRGVDALNAVTDKFVSFDFDSFVWTARGSSRSWISITSSADGTKLAAVVTNGQIYTSTDSGVTWTARESSRNWYSITSSSDGTKLAATVQNGQIYTSTDSGVTWTARDSNRNWRLITSSSDGTKLAATVQSGQIYTSTDSGVNWIARESSRDWLSITSSADGSKLAAIVSSARIYTSTDSGVNWIARESSRQWRSITSSADGTKLAAVVSGGQIYTSTDSGVTWTARESSRGWRSITSSADGTKLAAVVSGGQIYTSTDSGVTWTARDSSRSWQSITSSADGTKLAAAVNPGFIYISSPLPYPSSPTSSSTISTWTPSVEWSNALTCEYSYNNSTWSGVSCTSAGSDIPAPSSSGPTTLYLKGTTFDSIVSTSSVSFTYLAAQSGNSISQCGNITSPGTYTLTQDITDVSGTCFVVSANNVTINGGGFTVTASGGNTSYAVTSGSSTGLNLQDIIFSGFGQGSISSTATVTYSGTDIDLSNSTTTVSSLVITYTNTLTTLNTYFSNLSSLIINNIDLGSYTAGLFSWNQQDISTCQTLSSPGHYKLTQDITNVSGTCFIIDSDRVIIDGDGHTVSGEVGNTSYAIVATSTEANAYTNIGVKNLTLTGFGGGVDGRGADGNISQAEGRVGGNVTLYNVDFSDTATSVNLSGGNALYRVDDSAYGGNSGNLKVIDSTLSVVILNGGDASVDVDMGFDVGQINGGGSGTVTNINSTITTTTANNGLDAIPGCMDDSFDNYNPSATYNDGTCSNLDIGSGRDNPLGNTVVGQIDFYYYNNYGVVTGDANYYDWEINYNNGGGGNNYGTTTGFATFDNNYYASGANNYGYVGNGAYFYNSSSNYGVIDGNVTFAIGSNYGTINGNADFTQGGSSQVYNYGTVNGNAIFYSNNDYSGYYNQGTVTGTITNIYGCTDSGAVNYQSNAQNDDGGCAYYGSSSNLNEGVTHTGDLTFFSGYSNFGTIIGNAGFYTYDNSFNYGTTTGDVIFYGYYTGPDGDGSNNTMYVNGNFNYNGTGYVGGDIYDGNSTLISHIDFSNGQPNNYTTKGPVTFNDVSYNNGLIYYGDVTFNTTAYASTTPTGGVMSFEYRDWTGEVREMALDSDSNEINTYVFYGNTINYGIINGDAIFYDYSLNSGTINGDAIFYDSSYNAGTVNGNVIYMNASNGTLTLTGNQRWAGTVTGSIKGSDGIDITNLIFNDSSINETTIASTTTATFNNNASNNGTIQGDAIFNGTTFRIGTVNGTATLSGLAQTIQGVSNVLNFVKQSLTRDTLFLQQGSTLNVSGLLTIQGNSADNLLTIRSTVPGSFATLNINGTSDLNNLRIKDIRNTGLSQDVSTRTVFNDGGNTGFTFPANSTPSSRGAITSTYTPPSLPPSRIPPTPTPTPTPTPVVTNNTNRTVTQGGTIDSFFTKTVAPLLFKETQRFNLFNNNTNTTTNIGNTIIPKIFQNFKILNSVEFTKLPTNFLTNVTKFVLNKDNKPELFTVKSNNKSINTRISYNNKTNTVIQRVQTVTNQKLDIQLDTKTVSLTGTFDQENIVFNKGFVSITTPSTPGLYYLKADNSNTTLYVQVTASEVKSQSQQVEQVKKGGFIQWVKGLFRR